ncbi:MAG: methyltransferase domain-containing protein [Streptosporangiaceae bacterium]
MPRGERGGPALSWRCPVCRERLILSTDDRRWACGAGHSFDEAREGHVNLLLARHSRQPGDSPEMVRARRRFLASGAYSPLSAAIAQAVGSEHPGVVLDVGCGEGSHTRALSAPAVAGVDIAKTAVAAAARAHPSGMYAVASAADLPLADGVVDVAVAVFAPVIAAELARVIRPGGAVIIASPGPDHLEGLRRLVYPAAHAHEPKSPLGHPGDRFTEITSTSVRFPVVGSDAQSLRDLFAMTPYRWHAPPDIDARLAEAAARRFETIADIRISRYRRAPHR